MYTVSVHYTPPPSSPPPPLASPLLPPPSPRLPPPLPSPPLVSRKAMEKMQSVYQENPKLGDPNSLGQSLEQTSLKTAALVEEREKFQVYTQFQVPGSWYSVPGTRFQIHSSKYSEMKPMLFFCLSVCSL